MQDVLNIVELLKSNQAVAASDWPQDAAFSPYVFGLEERDGRLSWIVSPSELNPADLRQSLKQKSTDVTELEVIGIVDSTNSFLIAKAQKVSIHQHVCAAEFQFAGRGRRGRRWVSPYGRNLAISYGHQSQRALPELGGLSLVVGLAIYEAFYQLGGNSIGLKWPNDLLHSGEKIGGILIDLIQQGTAVAAVIGCGINVALTKADLEALDQPASDLRKAGVVADRNEILSVMLARIQQFIQHYETSGFAPFAEAFNTAHVLHGEICWVYRGSQATEAKVLGVSELGELVVETERGREHIHSGEVSVRPKQT